MIRIKVIIIAAALLIQSCAKAPEWNGDASISIEPIKIKLTTEQKQTAEIFSVKIFIRLSNLNSQKALTDLKGNAVLAPGTEETAEFPFTADLILPFGIESAVSEKEMPQESILKILESIGVDREKFLQEGSLPDHFLEEKDIKVIIQDYNVSGIIDILENYNKGKQK